MNEKEKKLVSLIEQEGPFTVSDFHYDEEEGLYFVKLYLPEEYESFQAEKILFDLVFDSVNFKERTILFVFNPLYLDQLIEM